MFSKKLLSLILIVVIVFSFTACSSARGGDNSDDVFVSAYPAFPVTSQSLHDGKWDEIITNNGENASPELTWEPVEGATTYVIYMIDMDTAYILHWKASDITTTSLPEGWAPSSDYIGPNPPEGISHKYNVYVFALKNPVENVRGGVRTINPLVQEYMDELDTDINGNTGNIIAVGRVSGDYSAK